ncbi:hypothetical protein HMPREF0239_01147 [Clostridium sp. ATCC BAA-442]|uniref:Uncharacterized protein n=1 Tax=Flavonifractor plautii ATCC 29863 TaxID=411475 RepID=G9YWN3_FLAPL|nr:hypothetical protein HMPREF0372_03950 [Flavonifractor plautii ATCC 29863]ERI78614.1 hypothetical protein HMPREF0239_01147 [Clostridium sp. ATCC BAA-442]
MTYQNIGVIISHRFSVSKGPQGMKKGRYGHITKLCDHSGPRCGYISQSA